jgi:hypothetical protein
VWSMGETVAESENMREEERGMMEQAATIMGGGIDLA